MKISHDFIIFPRYSHIEDFHDFPYCSMIFLRLVMNISMWFSTFPPACPALLAELAVTTWHTARLHAWTAVREQEPSSAKKLSPWISIDVLVMLVMIIGRVVNQTQHITAPQGPHVQGKAKRKATFWICAHLRMINERWDGAGWLWRIYPSNLPKENQEKQQQMRHSKVLLPVVSVPTTCRYAGWGTLWSLRVSRGTSSLGEGEGGKSVKLWALQVRKARGIHKYTCKSFSSFRFRTMTPTTLLSAVSLCLSVVCSLMSHSAALA